MPIAVILAVGQDYMVLDTRAAILRGAGYVVESASSTKQALDQFLAGDFDMVLLCHSIPLEERQKLTRLIRAFGSAVPVLYIAPFGGSSSGGLVDGTIGNSPGEILNGVKRALNGARARVSGQPRAPKAMQIASSSLSVG